VSITGLLRNISNKIWSKEICWEDEKWRALENAVMNVIKCVEISRLDEVVSKGICSKRLISYLITKIVDLFEVRFYVM
jgi:hypothetical protein